MNAAQVPPDAVERRAGDGVPWWTFVVTGIAWLVVSVVVLRFTALSLASVGVLVGVYLIGVAVNELWTARVRSSWMWVHALLGSLFLIGGITAIFNPLGTFWALSSILGLLLLLRGASTTVFALTTRDSNDWWWLALIVGLLEILLAFWVSGQFFITRAALIIVWVGLSALFRGISEIAFAFAVRRA
jgi:uncharacterized membrane protein HdeD (DUF308 family)